jgi:hypothetical protein
MGRKAAIPREVWEEAKALAEDGTPIPEVSARLGLKTSTVQRRSEIDKWLTPHRRIRMLDEATGDESAQNSQQNPAPPVNDATNSQLQQIRISDLPDLLAAAEAGPEAYRQAFQRYGQLAIAGALPSVPLPRTLAEVKIWADIVDKQTPKDTTAGNQIRHASRLSRAPIDIEPEPEIDGFRI